jgi:MHS family proline/betaine transporter-like MFS transporter
MLSRPHALSIPPSKVILSCIAGNTLEWFDFAVYGYIAPLMATQFFPSEHYPSSLLLMYSVFALGFFVRPLGAIFFGYIGDIFGRKQALVLSSLCMAIPTFCMGLLPTYDHIGLMAPIFLLICRIFQGLSAGGEFTGSFIYLTEHAPLKRRGFFSCWADLGCSLGMILGSSTVAFLSTYLSAEDFQTFGWRIPFFCGILLAFVGIYIRRQLTETPVFLNTKKHNETPLKDIFKIHPKKLFFATLLLAINALGYYILIVFMPNENILLGSMTVADSYFLNNSVLMALLISTFISATAGDFIDRLKIYKAGCIGCMALAYPLFHSMHAFGFLPFSFAWHLTVLILFALCIGCCIGPLPIILVTAFPVNVRFTAISLLYSLGNAIFGGTAPLIATFMVEKTGVIDMPSVMILCAGILTLIALHQLQRIKKAEEVKDKERTEKTRAA